jgi:pyridoxal/pyridoxine/pyridoxamine kinase
LAQVSGEPYEVAEARKWDRPIRRISGLARLVTPNLPEAELLSGIAIDGPSAIRAAARAIRRMGARAVVIKGGHPFASTGVAPAALSAKVVDLFYDGRRFIEMTGERIPGGGAHGTGCAFSAAVAAWLARGVGLETAVDRLIVAGPDTLGISWEEASPELMQAMQAAPLIIAKGQANYYVFSEHRAELRGEVFCLFTIKCQPVADVLGVQPKQAVGIFL